MALFGSSENKNKEAAAKPAQPAFVNQGSQPQPPQQPAAQPPQPAQFSQPPQPAQSPQPSAVVTEGKTPPPIPPTSSARPVAATLRDVAPTEPRQEALASIGRGSKVTGKLNFEGTVRIEGTVEGELSAGDTLHIGERAVVNAQVSGTVIVIRGQVTGDVSARKRVEIRAPGKLRGNVTTPSLVIDDGVTFEGYCSMGGEKAAASTAARK